MVTFGYGAVMFWIALTFKGELGFAKLFTMLTARELGLLLVSGGTIGLQFFRSRWEKQGRWGDVKRFAVALQGALFLATLAAGLSPALGVFYGVMALAAIALPPLNGKSEAPAE